MISVMLTPAELERARRLAIMRNEIKAGGPNHRSSAAHGDFEIHFAGLRAELAVCKMFNYPLDEGIYAGGDNHAADLYIGSYSVEVKAPFYRPPILKFDYLTDFKSDLAILCQVERSARKESVVAVYGVVDRHTFLSDHYTQDFGYGPRACMKAEDITPIEKFKEWFDKEKAS